MKSELSIQVENRINETWLTWIALRHFLPASSVRQICIAMVNKVSGGSITLERLFDEQLSGGPPYIESWLIRPLPTLTPIASYLQRKILSFVWQNDDSRMPLEEKVMEASAVNLSLVEYSIALGAGDFVQLPVRFAGFEDCAQSVFIAFDNALRLCKESLPKTDAAQLLNTLNSVLVAMPEPLKAVVIKHLGDLFADVDDWSSAYSFYENVKQRIDIKESDVEWGMFLILFRSVVEQSLASATLARFGNAKAAEILGQSLNSPKFKESPLFIANASFDGYVAKATSQNGFVPDSRSAMLLSPLLQVAHCPAKPLKTWIEGNFTESHNQFWALLRRQVALGFAVESRNTKAYFGRSIIDGLLKNSESHPQYFHVAVKLMLESENYKFPEELLWAEDFVDTYVDEECYEMVENHVLSHSGREQERKFVAISFFREWSLKISSTKLPIARLMLCYLVQIASSSTSSLWGSDDLLRPSLEAIKLIGKRRPELRSVAQREIAAVLSSTISEAGFWAGTAAALETASVFSSAFDDMALTGVIESTLKLLDGIDPNAEIWVVVRPAMELLIVEPVKQLSAKSPDLGKRIVASILRFGSIQESLSAQVLFYLHDFSSELLADSAVKDQLQGAIKLVRERSLKINSSNAVENIMAILVAPKVAGSDGVNDALNGLNKIFQSAGEKNVSIAFQSGYQPLIHLANHSKLIAEDASINQKDFDLRLSALFILLSNVWIKAKDKPSVFAAFSFTKEKKSDSVAVHNWAFASLIFAESLQKLDEMMALINDAADNPELKDAISLALATRLAAGDDMSLNIPKIANEDRNSFYSALGRRLAALHRMKNSRLAEALLKQCLRLGPRSVDAAAFASAISLDIKIDNELSTEISDYIHRIGDDRDSRLTLLPLLNMLKNSEVN